MVGGRGMGRGFSRLGGSGFGMAASAAESLNEPYWQQWEAIRNYHALQGVWPNNSFPLVDSLRKSLLGKLHSRVLPPTVLKAARNAGFPHAKAKKGAAERVICALEKAP